jgi:hypothetical protein
MREQLREWLTGSRVLGNILDAQTALHLRFTVRIDRLKQTVDQAKLLFCCRELHR